MQLPVNFEASRSPARAESGTSAGLARLGALLAVAAVGLATLAATAPAASVPPAAAALRPAAAVRPASAPADDGLEAPNAVAAPVHRVSPSRDLVAAGRPAASAAPAAAASPHTRAVPVVPAPVAPRPGPARPASSPPSPRQEPWLPSGTGMWIYQWDQTDGGSAASVLARARRVGLTTLYVRTGSTHDGFTGGAALSQLLPASRGTGVHVVAWDFPTLWHPRRDARRLAAAARWGGPGSATHVAAVAPDIETPAEGTFNAAWRVDAYLTALRRHLPDGVAVLGTVPWPSSYRVADYPYRTVAAHADALVPMAYWYDNPPKLVTDRSISYLRQFHRPVLPVGQGYDGRLDVPSLHHNHLAREVPRFLRAAHRRGARAVSLWSWQAAPPSAWHALQRAHHLFQPPASR